jgi:2-polyprenyl-3-methyl-5-hydroxy-6-metoxy-1,4-benzoquinol methylase
VRHRTGTIRESRNPIDGRLARERAHYNKLAGRWDDSSLVMPKWNIERYRRPSAATPFPLEFAFHLLGDIQDKTVLDLGCGDGLNTTILASLGANVVSVDISDKSLDVTYDRADANGVADRITPIHSDAADMPVEDASVDRVLCAAILHHVDVVGTARQIHRVLKPNGVAVFEEPMTGPEWVCAIKRWLPKNPAATDDECPLTLDQVRAVSDAVGRHGESRYFGVVARVTDRFGFSSMKALTRVHRLDAWLLKTVPNASAFASPLVWEARKVKTGQ